MCEQNATMTHKPAIKNSICHTLPEYSCAVTSTAVTRGVQGANPQSQASVTEIQCRQFHSTLLAIDCMSRLQLT